MARLKMDKRTVWGAAGGLQFFYMVTCGACFIRYTLSAQETEWPNVISNVDSIYFFVKMILSLVSMMILWKTEKFWTVNKIYLFEIVFSLWSASDFFFVLKLLYGCDDAFTNQVEVIIINSIHSAAGIIAIVIICICYTYGTQEDPSNLTYLDEESQTGDLKSIMAINNRSFINPSSFARKSETQNTHPINNTVPENKTQSPATEEEDNTITTCDITEETALTTADTDQLFTENTCTWSPLNKKKGKLDITRIYHRSNSQSKETQTDPSLLDEVTTTPITSPAIENIGIKYITTNSSMGEHLIPFTQIDRIFRKNNFAQK